MLMLDARVPAEYEGASVGGPQLLCARVNATKFPEDGDEMLSESLRGNSKSAAADPGSSSITTVLIFYVTAALITLGI